jgi:hypothetical protein
MFEITPSDIARLDDKQLRTLIGLLCEAELRQRGYSTAAVTYGGDQNAKDGGVDVRVTLPVNETIDGFIPRRLTGFQVKKQDMPPTEIAGEMRPKGELRRVIRDLAESGGAYIIVSSKGSTSDIALTNRTKAMADATKELADQPVLEFYDRTRLASWVRNHPGLVVWVRREVGRAIHGWEPFGAWAHPADGLEAEYLVEKGVRIRDRGARTSDDLSPVDGLQKIRGLLRNPASAVRLVGLSGVGKTRFVQALFDERIGENALDPALVVYTNINNEPTPQPFSFASDLIALRLRVILIIDNCAADLHGRLASLVTHSSCLLSILTVEYDIQDDLPVGTEVFEVRAASIELTEKLLKYRFPSLSQIDARTAAEFSGGNARMAIALADTNGRGGTLAQLSDTQLFERLFEQRQRHDRSLMETARTCALVYSFNGEDVSDSEEAELIRLASLAGASVAQAHSDVAELLRRELAQRRGKWRAVLPHALANRLAAIALQNIPFARIQEHLVYGAPQRLTISFSRRLGYLDKSEEAVTIVRDWLGEKGWIGEHIWNLNEFGEAIFRNCLPAGPETALRSLEINLPTHGADTPITTGDYVPRALRSLAWDATLFGRCAALLQKLAAYGEGNVAKEAAEIHTSLFYIYLSGTHATALERARVVRKMLGSYDASERAIGLSALNAMLMCNHFGSHYDFQFGAHSRDYGYHPQTHGDLTNWYTAAFAVAEEFALSDRPAAGSAETAVSANFRGLWTQARLHDELESIAARFAARGFWGDGWLAVKHTRYYDEKDTQSENYGRLTRLEEMLRPRDLVQQVRGRVFRSNYYDIDDINMNDANSFRVAMEQMAAESRSLGSKVAINPEALAELLPDIVRERGQLFYFGIGLAEGTGDPTHLWTHMIERFGATSKRERDTRSIAGFLWQLSTSKPSLAQELLDQAVENEPLAAYFPILQASVPINPRGMARLKRSLELGRVPIDVYSSIHLGRSIETVPASLIAEYIMSLARIPEGEAVAISHLHMQFFNDRQDMRAHAPEIIDTGRTILRQLDFPRRYGGEDHHLNGVVEVCVAGEEGRTTAKAMAEKLSQSVAEHRAFAIDHNQTLKVLFKKQPKAMLDALLTGDEKAVKAGASLISQSNHLRQNQMDEVSEDLLFDWCFEDPANRLPALALLISAFTLAADYVPNSWTPLALRLVHSAPDPLSVMEIYIKRLRPMSWRGSRSAMLQNNANLLDQFDVRGNAALAALIEAGKVELRREADEHLEFTTTLDREHDQRFE